MYIYKICDPLSENPTSLHYYQTSLLSRGKNNELSKFQPCLVNSCGVIVIDNRKCKTIDLYSDYMEENYRCSFNQS